jgi:hypothetical protein
MNKRHLLVGAWTVVAAILLYFGILDVLRWRADPELTRLGLDWADSYVPHGTVAAIVAVTILSAHRVGLWTAVVASSLFGLYFAAYLVFGGEGAFLLRVIIPLTLLCLTGVTIRYALGLLSSRKQMPTT